MNFFQSGSALHCFAASLRSRTSIFLPRGSIFRRLVRYLRRAMRASINSSLLRAIVHIFTQAPNLDSKKNFQDSGSLAVGGGFYGIRKG